MQPKTTIAAMSLALGLSALGVGAAYAAQQTNDVTKPMDDLVTAIATKFNLNTADVQAVFDEQHVQMEADMEQHFSNHVQDGVTAGDITQEQADLIQAKHDELKNDKPDFSNMTDEEREADMKARMESMQQWAEDNDIPKEYMPGGPVRVFKGGPDGGHGGPMGERHFFEEQVDDSSN